MKVVVAADLQQILFQLSGGGFPSPVVRPSLEVHATFGKGGSRPADVRMRHHDSS